MSASFEGLVLPLNEPSKTKDTHLKGCRLWSLQTQPKIVSSHSEEVGGGSWSRTPARLLPSGPMEPLNHCAGTGRLTKETCDRKWKKVRNVPRISVLYIKPFLFLSIEMNSHSKIPGKFMKECISPRVCSGLEKQVQAYDEKRNTAKLEHRRHVSLN